jgi:hypothetical protein
VLSFADRLSLLGLLQGEVERRLKLGGAVHEVAASMIGRPVRRAQRRRRCQNSMPRMEMVVDPTVAVTGSAASGTSLKNT